MQGLVKYRVCGHGVVKIDDYESTGNVCEKCDPRIHEKAFNTVDTKPYFNQGLGCVTNGTRHAEKIAKQRGLVPIGDASLRQVAKQHWGEHPLTERL